jgi:hypothetical protein
LRAELAALRQHQFRAAILFCRAIYEASDGDPCFNAQREVADWLELQDPKPDPTPTREVETDDHDPDVARAVAESLLFCAESHEPGVRLVGNVRADEIEYLCRYVLLSDEPKPDPETAALRHTDPNPPSDGELIDEADAWGAPGFRRVYDFGYARGRATAEADHAEMLAALEWIATIYSISLENRPLAWVYRNSLAVRGGHEQSHDGTGPSIAAALIRAHKESTGD